MKNKPNSGVPKEYYDELMKGRDKYELIVEFHSHASDALEDNHPLAHEDIECTRCGVLVHAPNNECMRTWVELPQFDNILCSECFGDILRWQGGVYYTDPFQRKSHKDEEAFKARRYKEKISALS